MENNETKFPSSILEHLGYINADKEKAYFFRGGGDAYPKTDVEEWFKKCMEDFPTMYSGIAIVNGSPVQATMELPPVLTYWFNRWFGQFVEGK